MKKTLVFDFEIAAHTLARLDSLMDRTFVHLGILDSDTAQLANEKFIEALKKGEWSPLTREAALIAWFAATDQMHPSYRLEYSETGMLIGVLAQILGDWQPMRLPRSLFGGEAS